jgi:hypothetical protein
LRVHEAERERTEHSASGEHFHNSAAASQYRVLKHRHEFCSDYRFNIPQIFKHGKRAAGLDGFRKCVKAGSTAQFIPRT